MSPPTPTRPVHYGTEVIRDHQRREAERAVIAAAQHWHALQTGATRDEWGYDSDAARDALNAALDTLNTLEALL